MTHIAVISHDERFVEQVRACGVDPIRISISNLETYARAADAPRALLIDIRHSSKVPPSLSAFCRQHAWRVALVVATLEPALMLEAMRAGVIECIAEPITGRVLEDALQRILADNENTKPSGQVFAFVGAKGGVGTTTLAVNTAASVARASKRDVLLIDLHIGHGDGALLLGAEPRFSVIDALENVHKVDASFFSGLVEKTESGVHLLASGSNAMQAPIDERRLRALLEAGARMYGFTVLDVPRVDAVMLNILDTVTAFTVVTTQELAALRYAGHLADSLRQRYGGGRVRVVLNRSDRHSMIAHADVERATGGPVTHLIPSDYRTAIEALNTGRPLAVDSQSRLGSAFRTLARDLAGLSKERVERPSGVLTRFALRRA